LADSKVEPPRQNKNLDPSTLRNCVKLTILEQNGQISGFPNCKKKQKPLRKRKSPSKPATNSEEVVLTVLSQKKHFSAIKPPNEPNKTNVTEDKPAER